MLDALNHLGQVLPLDARLESVHGSKFDPSNLVWKSIKSDVHLAKSMANMRTRKRTN